ncbi:hypothetical protein [Lactobacillus sp. LL6]|uniref:hypothetical protein n=1 Tax=Lactobacillus sp. LL6 TaxID=2596827 RepID=UPI00118594C9|nr:hypothetical protein [Lactobacillus sp. LL6]TSO25691.1 hypothetical protein FOD82_01030 [Lactobacillus sp. LL6]
MKKVNEIESCLTYTNLHDLKETVINLIQSVAPDVPEEDIQIEIDNRNKQGEGLMSQDSLSLHIQDRRINHDTVIYLKVSPSFDYYSRFFKQKFEISKLVLIIVNPNHQLDRLTKLTSFITEEG